MEGVFSFFLESTFLGLFLFGEKRLGPRVHWLTSLMMFLGSWLSGYFIVLTDAWMQHPVGYQLGPNGSYNLQSYWALLLNPWGIWQYAHTMIGAVQTGSSPWPPSVLTTFYPSSTKNSASSSSALDLPSASSPLFYSSIPPVTGRES
jgi:hypothetical protein